MSERVGFSPEIDKGNELIKRIKNLNTFSYQPFSLDPYGAIVLLVNEVEELIHGLPDISEPKSLDQLTTSELKRRLVAEKALLKANISTDVPDWEQVVESNGVPAGDLVKLEEWLDSNLDGVREANDRNFARVATLEDRRSVHLGSRQLREEAEDLVEESTRKMVELMKTSFAHETGLLDAMDNYRLIVDSWEDRSSCNLISKVVAISTKAVTYMRSGKIFLDTNEFVELIGHEFFGHARHFACAENATSLPYFLRVGLGTSVSSSKESIAQYFERRFFDVLRTKTGVSNSLGFEEDFEDIYKQYLDTSLITKYKSMRYRFAVLTMAKSQPDAFGEQVRTIGKYSPLEPSWPSYIVNYHKNDWDRVSGRLRPGIVGELRYIADPVARIMDQVNGDSLAQVESLMLTGFWMPQGLEDWVRLNLANS